MQIIMTLNFVSFYHWNNARDPEASNISNNAIPNLVLRIEKWIKSSCAVNV